MKTVLCYGDSLTWGYDAETGGRHAYQDRWPTVLGEGLGSAVLVIPDGLSGRTTIYDDNSVGTERNGARTLATSLATHQPLDLVILALGTNDLKRHTGGGRAFEARIGMERLVEIVQCFPYQRGFSKPDILLVCPPHFTATEEPDYALLFEHGLEESTYLPAHAGPLVAALASCFARVADEYGCHHFDAAEVCETTPLDGVHLDALNTRRLGEALVPEVRKILSAA